MCKKAVLPLLLTVALAQAGIVPFYNLDYLEGPSTKTKVIGPDGSIIDAYLPGGRIDLSGHNAPLLQTVPVVVASEAVQQYDSYALGIERLAADEPLANIIEVDETTKRAIGSVTDITNVIPVSRNAKATLRFGPDGEPKVFLHPGTPPRVETRESVPVTEFTDENTETTEFTEFTTTESTTILPNESDGYFSGRYIHDNFESLYDDGSYRAEHF